MQICHQRIVLSASAACLLAAAGAFGAEPNLDADRSKLRADLPEVIEQAAAAELIPISIVMAEQADQLAIDIAAATPNKPDRRAEVRQTLQTVAQRTQGSILEFLQAEQENGKVSQRLKGLWLHNVIIADATADVIVRLSQRADVAYINYDRPVGREIFPVEPQRQEQVLAGGPAAGGDIECGVDLMGAPQVWNDLGFTGAGVVVGIIDTGCCHNHPDLVNQIWNNDDEIDGNGVDDDDNGYIDDIRGYNFRDGNANTFDEDSHGTHTGGTVIGDGTNGLTSGMAPDAELMILKMWNDFSGESVIWEAMQYAVDNDADVITASIGWPHGVNPDRPTWREVCENAIAAGVVVVYAAGNEGNCCGPFDNVRTPGDVPDVLTIGATNCSDGLAGFSSLGPVTWQSIPPYNDWPYPPGKVKPSVSGPGVDTWSTSNDCSGYSVKSGTSMATPHVAGAAALMLEANPNLDHFGVKDLLAETAVDLGLEGWDNSFGAGRVDALAAVTAAMEGGGLPGDLDGDGIVGTIDLILLLGAWGPCADCGDCPADLDGNCIVRGQDLIILLGNWG